MLRFNSVLITAGAGARYFSFLRVHFTFIDFFTSRFLCSNPPGFRGKRSAVASIFIGQNGENAQTPIKLLRPCRNSGVPCRRHVRARLVQIEFGSSSKTDRVKTHRFRGNAGARRSVLLRFRKFSPDAHDWKLNSKTVSKCGRV